MDTKKSREFVKTFLPISINITDIKILVIGGGRTALQKVRILQKFTSPITVLAPEITGELKKMQKVSWVKEKYSPGHLNGCFLVYACTNNHTINRQIYEDAKKENILVNVADNPDLSDFVSPAIALFSDGMTIAVGSNARDPKKAVEWRNKLKKIISDDTTF
jgi:siroheme synthase-like protein